MPDEFSDPAPPARSDDEAGIFGWLRWWHSLILLGLFLFGVGYFPLWRFDQRWKQIQVGDSFDRVKSLLGEPGDADYTAAGFGTQGNYQAYGYRVYWRSYEVQISPDTRRVVGKSVDGKLAPSAAPNQPASGPGAPTKQPKR